MKRSGRRPRMVLAAGCLLLASVSDAAVAAPLARVRTLDGDWQGACKRNGKLQRADLMITERQVSLNGQAVKGLVRRGERIHFDVDSRKLPLIFSGQLSADGAMIRGVMSAPGQSASCSFGRCSRGILYGGLGLPPNAR